MKKIIILLISLTSSLTTIGATFESQSGFTNAENTYNSICKDYFELAIKDDDVFTVRQCIENGEAYINKRNNAGNTPVMIAIKSKSLDVANFLVDKGANLQIKNRKGKDILALKEIYAFPKFLKKVIEKGVEPQMRKNIIAGDHIEAVKLLLSLGAKGKEKHLEHAIEKSAHSIIKYYVQNLGFDINLPSNKTGYMLLVRDLKTLELIFELGGDLYLQTKDGENLFHWLAFNFGAKGTEESEYLKMFKFLSEKGLDINSRTRDGLTPFFYLRAVSIGFKKIDIKTLIDLGMNIQSKDNNGNNIVIETIIRYTDPKCMYPATAYNFVTEYIELGVDPKVENNNGETALDITEKRCPPEGGRWDFCKMLADYLRNL